ncbi:MAG: S-layer homology domain-containing protein [Oscillospiraceae bacterium]|nr:S-layer homology domain-containing protein [Oscillospiraceae bacterium]MBQ9046252.1 S-layer homology domain-containing protein [Oscillospiraceae bacterium]
MNYPNSYLPYHDINPAMLKSATYMGAHVNYAAGHVQVTPEWWENDGIVSVRSAIAPHENSTDRINENYGTAADGTMVFKPGTEKGGWNYIEKIERTDHINMVGQTKNKSTLQPKFYELAAMLASIPADTKAPAEHVCPGAGFTDMPAYGNWAHTGLDYCIEHGLIKGTSATTVSPNTALSRAQLVTILWRQAGSPGAKHAAPFTDLTQEWYRQAVAWAAEHQIVKGVSATRFDPDSAVTRQDMTVILYRYADSELHADVSGTADLSGFPDADRVSAYAEQAMRWAVSEALIQGTLVNGTVYLDPKGTTTRAQAAKILMTFCKTVAG